MRLRSLSLLVALFAFASTSLGQNASTPVNFTATSVGSSSTQTATLVFQSSGTVASIQVLTLGAPDLDFQAAAGGSCTTAYYSASASCTVNVSFAPLYPGMRMGAVVLADGSGNTLAMDYVGGVGNGALLDYPAGQLHPISGSFTGPTGVAVDGAGNLYVSDYTSKVIWKVAASNGAVSAFYNTSSSENGPLDVAVDGAGNVYYPDGPYGHVYKIPPSGGTATNIVTGASYPFAVALDAVGNLYVADYSGGVIRKVPSNGGAATSVVTGLGSATGVAIDAAGNIYIAENGVSPILKAASGSSTATTLGSYIYPNQIAVDPAGHLYATSTGYGLYQVTASGSAKTMLVADGTDGLALAKGVTLDGAGNVYFTDMNGHQVFKLDRSDPQALSFGPTEVDTDSASQTVAVENDGNQPLNFTTMTESYASVVSVGSDCSTSSALAVGADCNLGIEFAPTVTGAPVSGSVQLADNAPNTPQSIPLSGISTSQTPLVFSTAPPTTLTAGGNAGTVSVSIENGGVVQTGSSASVTLTVSGPSGYSASYGPTSTSSGVVSFNLASATLATAGEYTYTATATGFSTGTANETVLAAPYDFTNTNVGVASSTVPVTLTVQTAGTPAAIAVLTQGVAGVDFTYAAGGTCATSTPYNVGDTCTVNVVFTPAYPGQRMGAVQLQSASGAVLATEFISGTGEGPLMVFTPQVQTSIATTGSGTPFPNAVAIDAAGNLYIADYNYTTGRIVKMPPSGSSQTVLWSGAAQVLSLAVDGAGTVYFIQSGTVNLSVLPLGASTASNIAFAHAPQAVTVDGAGNVYVYINYNSTGSVVKIAAGTGTQTTIATVASVSGSSGGIAIDTAGNIYVISQYDAQVTKIAAGGSQSKLGSSLSETFSVAVDAAGNLYVAEYEANQILMIPAGGGSQTTLPFTGMTYATFAAAVDGAGNVYAANWGQDTVFKLSGAAVPALSFDTTEVGQSSAAQTVGIENLGNQALSFTSITPVSNASVTATTCSTSIPLIIDASCNLSIAFAPTASGTPASGSVSLTDNAAASPQSITLSGNALTGAQMPTHFAVSAPTTVEAGGSYSFTVTAKDSGGSTVTSYTGMVAFTSSDVNAVFPANNVTITNGTGSYNFILASAGNQTITATDSANSITGSSATIQVVPSNYVAPATSVGNSSTAQTVTFILPSAVTLGSIKVLTGGASGLDYLVAAGGSCATGTPYASGATCTVNYTFTPAYPGWRLGAIQLYDNAQPTANLVSTVYLSGIGNAPLAVLGKGVVGCGLNNGVDPDGIAIDGNGTIYVPYSGNNNVSKYTSACILTTLGTGSYSLSGPSGIAVDGAGNIFIADTGNNRIVKVTQAGAASLVSLGSYSFKPFDVAVDGAGNLYLADYYGNRIVNISASGVASVLSTPGLTLNEPEHVTADGAGNVYISDSGNGRVVKVSAAGAASVVSTSGIPILQGSTIHPAGLAVDAGGDLYITDYYYNTYSRIIMVSPGGTASVLSLNDANTSNTGSIAIGPSGNVFLASNNYYSLIQLIRNSSQTMSFANTLVGQTSAAQTLAVQNIGNQPLDFNAITPSTDFNLNGTTCSTSSPLAVGAGCTMSVEFAPLSRGYFAEDITFNDNSLNNSSLNDSIPVNGSGTGTTDALLTDSYSTPQSAGIGAAFPYDLEVQLVDPSNNPISGATITFSAPTTGASATLSSTTAVTSSQGWADITATANNTLGNYNVTATYNGVTATFNLTNVMPPAYTVTTTADDVTGVAAHCTNQTLNGATLDANCSLRDAIAAANAAYVVAIAPTISFAPALTNSAPATITLGAGGALTVNTGVSMTITGPGASLLTISGAGQSQVFAVSGFASAAISGLTITNGNSASGGGIGNQGVLTLTNVAVTNSTSSGEGGGIWNIGGLALTNCTISGNTAATHGGGIANSWAISQTVTNITIGGIVIGTNTNYNTSTGTVTISNSTIANNTAAAGKGGGLYNSPISTSGQQAVGLTITSTTTSSSGPISPYISVTGSTITGNSALLGGGIYNGSAYTGYTPLVIEGSTITGNSAVTGGGVNMAASSLAFQNDIVTGNSATTAAPDFTGTTTDGGGNILGQSSGTGTSAGANLATLGSYGGFAPTMPPLPGSTAICAGLTANVPSGVTTDERGNPLPTTVYSATPCVDAGAVQTAYSLAFSTQPTTTHENASITPSPAVQLKDNGAVIPLPGAAISISAAAGTLSGTLSQSTASTGIATFPGLSINAIETGDSLTASIPASTFTKTATSNTFNVTTNIVTVDHYTISVPANATAGTPFNATVTARDSSGNTLTTYTGPVTFTSSDAAAVLPGSTALSSGAATVSVTLKSAGSQTVTATDGSGSPSVTSAPIAVGATSASAVTAVSGGGQSATIGAAFASSLKAKVADAYGNPVSGATVTFTAPSSGASAGFSTPAATASDGTTTVTATANGVASATAYSVTASVSGGQSTASFSLTNTQAATTLTVTPTATALAYGQPVSIHAVITPANVLSSAPTGSVTFYDGVAALTPASTASSAAASFSVSVPAVGSHTYKAQYGGDSNFAASALTAANNAVAVSTASVTLSGSPASVTYGQTGSIPVTLTGQYTGAGISVPGGSSSLSYTIVNAASATVASGSLTPTAGSGSSSVSIPVPNTLAGGSYTVNVSYSGDGNFSASSTSIALTIAQASQTITFTPPATPVSYGVSPITLSATSTSGLTVAFSILSGPGSINGNQLTVTGAGAINIAANQAGNANYSAAQQAEQSITVNKVTLTATAAQQTIVYGQPIAPFTVGITGFVGQDSASNSITGAASFTTSPSNPSAVGQYTIIPALGTLASANYSFSFVNGTLKINAAQAAITGPALASQPVFVVLNTTGSIPVTVAGPYTGAGIAPPSGSVTYTVGSGSLQTAALSSGTANIVILNTLAAAQYTVTVNYAGDSNYSAATQLTFQVLVSQLIPDFSIATSGGSTSVTAEPGGAPQYSLLVSPTNTTTFLSPVSFTLSGLPAGYNYNFSPSTLNAGWGATQVTLTINVPQTTAMRQASGGRWPSGAPFALALLLLPLARRLRRAGRRMGRMMTIVLLAAGMAAVATLSGCGTNAGYFGQRQVSYPLTVTATAGTLTHTTNITLTVE